MKFQLAINMERMAPDLDMIDVERHTLEMVQMADKGGEQGGPKRRTSMPM